MTPELLALALDYGWGCKSCEGTGEAVTPGVYLVVCPDCHGNRITEADRAEFERRLVEVVRTGEAARLGGGANPRVKRIAAFYQALDNLQHTPGDSR